MKTLFTFTLLCLSLIAQADSLCGGQCVNTTSKSFMNQVCANSVPDLLSCEQFSMVGCGWKEFSKKVVRGSLCVNGTKDRTLDAKCAASKESDKTCVKSAGCVWVPAAVTCQH